MKIADFIKTKTITKKELEENFEVYNTKTFKQFEKDDVCWNCGEKANVYFVKSEPWTTTQYCNGCDKISMRIKCEPMGGNHNEDVTIYERKQETERN